MSCPSPITLWLSNFYPAHRPKGVGETGSKSFVYGGPLATPLRDPSKRLPGNPRRLHLYELWRKEPLYNPRWPPPRRGLLLANTRQEAPPWLTARDGMIYWDFCLFAPALLQRTYRVPSLPRRPVYAWNTAILDFDVSPRIAAATSRGFLLPRSRDVSILS